MSLQEFHRLVTERVTEARAELTKRATSVRFSPSSLGGDGKTFMPHVGAEQIGLLVMDANAESRGLEAALKIVAEVYRMMTEPKADTASDSRRQQNPSEHREAY